MLDKIWHERHMTMLQSQAPQIPEPPKKTRAETMLAKCCSLGFCVHEGPGLEIDRCYTRFANTIKLYCPIRSGGRKALVDGDLVVRMIGRASDGPIDEEANMDAGITIFFHLASISLSPWSLSVQVMRPVADIGEVSDGRERLYLEVAGDVYNNVIRCKSWVVGARFLILES